jgi:hypothetical protein
VFALQAIERRFLLAGAYAQRAVPADAFVLAVQESGAIRFHGGRPTIVWDAIDSADLQRVIDLASRDGRDVYFALEDLEEPRFRQRFRGAPSGALDWPPVAELHGRVRVRFYRVRDRAAFLAGARLTVEHVRETSGAGARRQ